MPSERSSRPRYRFAAALWQARAEAPWVFVTLPEEMADEIAEVVPRRTGFGAVRVSVRIGSTRWQTSIFPDAKAGSYVLPVKRAVRLAEHLEIGDTARVVLELQE